MSRTGSRRGRRPGAPDTKAAILVAARDAFAAGGLPGTSVRAIAADAGVDPSLVHHYFGSKEDLFVAALALRVDPRVALRPVLEGGLDGAGERLMQVFVSVWDDREARTPLLALVRGVVDPAGQRLLRDGVLQLVIGPVVEALDVDRPALRASLIAAQLMGLVLVRYVAELDPLAALPPDDVVGVYGPILQRLLADPLPSA